MIASVSC